MQNKTFIVLGAYFSGTSMVSGTLRHLGIIMGEKFNNSGNYEDIEFQLAGLDEIRKLIKKRNIKYPIWGWKDPDTINYIELILEILRNPYFIVVFRDLVAISEHTIKHFNGNITKELLHNNAINTRLTSFIFRYFKQYPFHLISYEKAIKNKKQYIIDISNFCSIDLPTDKFDKIMVWLTYGKYKHF